MVYREIKSVEPFSMAIVTGIILGLLALIAAILLLAGMEGVLYTIPYVQLTAKTFGKKAVVWTLPLLYFAIGFVVAYIVAVIYNFVSRKYRGIRIELE